MVTASLDVLELLFGYTLVITAYCDDVLATLKVTSCPHHNLLDDHMLLWSVLSNTNR